MTYKAPMQPGYKLRFDEFTHELLGLPVNRLWRGHGSAIFLELGELKNGVLPNGKSGGLAGQFTVMIEWSWRVEGRRSILCGSWSDEKKWERGFSFIRDKSLVAIETFGNLPEIDLTFSSGAHLLSFMTAENEPAWTIFDKRRTPHRWVNSKLDGVEICVSETTG